MFEQVFFHRAHFLSGELDHPMSSKLPDSMNPRICGVPVVEHAWVDKKTLVDYFDPSLYETVKDLLN